MKSCVTSIFVPECTPNLSVSGCIARYSASVVAGFDRKYLGGSPGWGLIQEDVTGLVDVGFKVRCAPRKRSDLLRLFLRRRSVGRTKANFPERVLGQDHLVAARKNSRRWRSIGSYVWGCSDAGQACRFKPGSCCVYLSPGSGMFQVNQQLSATRPYGRCPVPSRLAQNFHDFGPNG